jgi:hypothetical protein
MARDDVLTEPSLDRRVTLHQSARTVTYDVAD